VQDGINWPKPNEVGTH